MAPDAGKRIPAVMTIAGSDSSGGAGIQADLKTITAFGCYGTSVITALTAQNTTGVQDVHGVPPNFVDQQIRSVISDISIKAIKTGMLFSANVVRTVVQTLRLLYSSTPLPPLVCDPVCVSTSGHTLLLPDALDVLVAELFPLAALITPNKSEAELLLARTGRPTTIASLEDMLSAADALRTLGAGAVLLKGGHLTADWADVRRVCAARPALRVNRDGILGENMEILLVTEADPEGIELVVDVLCEADGAATLFVRPRIDSESTHGTGCTLSAAIACALAQGADCARAVEIGAEYTHQGIATAFPVGKGHGPLNHMHPILHRSIPSASPTNPHPFVRLLIRTNADIWKQYVQHDFVKQLGRGVLPRENFIHFIKQDYLYLKYYARAHALLGAKSTDYDGITASAKTMAHIVQESGMHKLFCAKWGISETELEGTPESPGCTAYGAYIVDIGMRGDASRLLMALAACLLGYGEVGLWLRREAERPNSWVKLEGNPYLKWIEDYSGEDYQAAVKAGIERIEAMAAADPPSPARFEEWRLVWEKCTRLEKGFWDMAMDQS